MRPPKATAMRQLLFATILAAAAIIALPAGSPSADAPPDACVPRPDLGLHVEECPGGVFVSWQLEARAVIPGISADTAH